MSKNILLRAVTFQYPNMLQPLFNNLNLSINEKWKLGLIGKNGVGKTTFFNLLQNKLPYTGQIETPLAFKYFPNYPNGSNSEQTIDVLIRRNPTIETWEIMKEFNELALPQDLLYQPFSTLSGGEQTKILLLELFLDQDSFPLIDEPTNNLDLHGRKIVAEYLNKQTGYIVISHDETFLNQFVDHVLSINKSTVEIIAGNIETWRTEFEHANQLTIERNSQLKSEISRLKESSQRIAHWGSQRENVSNDASSRRLAAKQMKRSKAVQKRREDKIQEKAQLIDNVATTSELEMHVLVPRNRIITLRNFSIIRNGVQLFEPIHLELMPEERVFVTGDNGVGKSTLLNFILDPTAFETLGEYDIQLPQNVSFLQQKLFKKTESIAFIESLSKEKREVLWRILSELGISQSTFSISKFDQWSEGEFKKINIAKNLIEPTHLYIWDELTNHLDIDVIAQLIDTFQLNKPTMLAVDHNEKFVREVGTKKITLEKPLTF